MNVYDFDGTIYDGDCTIDFYFYCLKKHPLIVMSFPRQLTGMLKYKANLIDKTKFKEEFYSYFQYLKNIDTDVITFWDLNQHKIKDWYLEAQQMDDLVISASPEFLLQEICKRYHIINLIASVVNKNTGKYSGTNCYGEEKVRRYYERFADKRINKFYSDSKSDQPMANISAESYIVDRNMVKIWGEI